MRDSKEAYGQRTPEYSQQEGLEKKTFEIPGCGRFALDCGKDGPGRNR